MKAAYRRTHSPGRLAWPEGQFPIGSLHLSYEPSELSQWSNHQDIIINIVFGINIPRNLLDVISETFTANPLTGAKRPAFSTNRLADIDKLNISKAKIETTIKTIN